MTRSRAAPARARRPTLRARFPWQRAALPLIALALLALYGATLQTHISGTFDERTPDLILKNETIKDVAEIQVALNIWGTIHHTGYPLFAVLGNLFTAPLRALGVEPAAAASLYALAWGALFLGAVFVLLRRLTGRPLLAGLTVATLGLAKSVWLHAVVAEVYGMSMAITALLWAVALWPAPWRGAWSASRRLAWLALLGGIGVAHHRAVIFVAPGLLWAVWPHRADRGVRWRALLPRLIGLGLLGFLPYLYLPLRARMGGAWVYGEPGTLRGLWIEFSGREADRLVRLPADLGGLWGNARSVVEILVRELTLPGLGIALAALAFALVTPRHRHTMAVLGLSALGPLLFALFFHTAVFPQAVLLPVVAALLMAVALAADALLAGRPRLAGAALAGLALWAGVLAAWNFGPIRELTTERTGIETIEQMARVPRAGRPALLLPWGPRYAAAAYAALVTGEQAGVRVVQHKADFAALRRAVHTLYTFPATFYTFPPPWETPYGPPSDWWPTHFGPLTLTSAAPGVVELRAVPWLAAYDDPPGELVVDGIRRRDAWLTCDADALYLHVVWEADVRPSLDPSIFVHLTEDTPAPSPPGADQRHPVYSLYPFSRLSPGELVRDDFILPRLPGKTQVRFGLYETGAGGFTNYGEAALAVGECSEQ